MRESQFEFEEKFGKSERKEPGVVRRICEYNEQGNKLLETQKDANGTTKKTTYKYDGEGNLEEVLKYDGAKIKSKTTYKYDGERNLEEVLKYDGAKIKSKTTYKYYKDGNIKEEVKYDGTKKITTIFGYDKKGNITKEVKRDGAKKITTTFEYDKEGNEVERKWYDASNLKDSKGGIICKYDKKGNKLEEVHYGVKGKKFIKRTKYKYDKKRNLKETVKHYANGAIKLTYFARYDNGKLSKEEQYDDNGIITSRITFQFVTNGENNLEEDRTIRKEEQFDANEHIEFTYTTSHDDKRNLLEEVKLDAMGDPIFKRFYKYDEEGNRVESVYFRNAPPPFNRTFRYEFDEKRNCTSFTQFDAMGTPIDKTTFEYDPQGNKTKRTTFKQKTSFGKINFVKTAEKEWKFEFHTGNPGKLPRE